MKTTIRFFLIASLLVAYVSIARGFGNPAEGCGGDCAGCHPVTKKDIQTLVDSFGPGTEVIDVKPAPVRGLFQALVRNGAEETILYADFSKRFLISGRIFDSGQKKDITREEMMARKRVDVSAINTEHALLLGNPAGSRKIYVFTDPDCPFCATLHEELTRLVAEDPLLLVYIMLFPLDIHPDAAWKTDSIICAAKTNMAQALSMLSQSFNKVEIKKAVCDNQYADAVKRRAAELGIGMTPTIVTADGRMILGMKKKDELRKLIGFETKATIK